VNPKFDSNAPAKVIFAPAGGGLIFTEILLYNLLNLMTNSTNVSSNFFFIELNSISEYPWFLFSPHL